MAITIYECKQCGYKWVPRVEHPEKCPRCQAVKWNEKKSNNYGRRRKLQW